VIPVAFDVETTGLQWYAHELFLAQFGEGDYTIARRHPDEREWIADALQEDAAFYAHNTKFDMHFAEAAGYKLPERHRWHDTKIMASLIDERGSTALKARASALTGPQAAENEKAVKDWLAQEGRNRRRWSKEYPGDFPPEPVTYADVPDDIMVPYALEDLRLTHLLRETYEPTIRRDEQLSDLYELERATMSALYDAERTGIPIDRDALVRLEAELLDQHAQIEDRCIELAGIPHFNPRSPAQVSEGLIRRGKDKEEGPLMTKYATTRADGTLSTTEEDLQAIDDDLARAVLEYRGVQKMYAMVKAILHGKDDGTAPFLAPDDRLHPFFWQNGARTGRMSCSDPNIQQWHRDDLRMRYLVRPQEGHKLVCCDYDSIELRIFAAFCGPGAMLSSVKQEGADPHTMAAQSAGLGERRRSTGAVESQRQRGKTLNYSVMYGAGVRSMRKAFGVDTNEARKILARYHEAFPEVSRLQQRIEFALYDRGEVKTPWGRRQRVERNVDREAYKFTNYLIQGTAADLLKQGLANAHAAGLPVIAAVHDELVCEVPAEDAEDAAHALQEAMVDDGGRLSGTVPIKAEPIICDRWSGAKDPDYTPDYMED
jgi:DNA polymerase-1